MTGEVCTDSVELHGVGVATPGLNPSSTTSWGMLRIPELQFPAQKVRRKRRHASQSGSEVKALTNVGVCDGPHGMCSPVGSLRHPQGLAAGGRGNSGCGLQTEAAAAARSVAWSESDEVCALHMVCGHAEGAGRGVLKAILRV